MTLSENTVIKPGIGDCPIDWPHRILMVDLETRTASVIGLPGALGKTGKKATHVGGPKLVSLDALEAAIARNALVVTPFEAPGHWAMNDEEYLAVASTAKERERRKSRLAMRTRAWDLIKPIVGDLPVREIAKNPARLRPKVLKQAKESQVNITTVYRTVNIYLASGGVRSSLMPNTHLRGAPGKEKAQSTKLGRKSRLEKSGESSESLYTLEGSDARRLANGYMLRGGGKTLEDAYLLTCSVFWSTLDSSGKANLFPPNERPTFVQFKYWGRKLNAPEDRKRRIESDMWRARITAGSTQDQVRAVGQVAMIDSTSTDVYLVSMMSRLKKLPPMHRTIVKEIRSTAVIGFHLGWESPSSATALQAVLSSAESKVDICARFGIEIREDDWPGMLCKLYLADNGEMKAKFITEAELEFRFGVEYVRAYSGQSKSDVENQHHTDHKRLDHKLPGTTKGRQRERGEAHPADEALWNYYEYMREFLLMVIAYNNEEVEHLAPTQMLKDGISPTRINILKWMMVRNMRADIPCQVDQLRAYTLPSCAAVMTKTGILLVMPDGKRHVPGIRFYAPDLQTSPAFIQAIKTGGTLEIKVKRKEDDLSQIWFTLPSGLARIPNVSSDDDLKREGTLVDYLQWVEAADIKKDQQRPTNDQAKLDRVLRNEATTMRAKKERDHELGSLSKRPSKKDARSQLRKNREEEMAALQSQALAVPVVKSQQAEAASDPSHAQATSDAMDSFMQHFA
jgi:hypothetical protein